MNQRLDALVEELESLAARLRGEELGRREAADLVERCAKLTAEIGAELDAVSRAASEAEEQERQERLL